MSGRIQFSFLASRSRHFSYSEIELYFQLLVKFFSYRPDGESRPVSPSIRELFKCLGVIQSSLIQLNSSLIQLEISYLFGELSNSIKELSLLIREIPN